MLALNGLHYMIGIIVQGWIVDDDFSQCVELGKAVHESNANA